jgi:hypothetical protein
MSQAIYLTPTSGPGSGTVTSITFNGGLTSTPDPVTTTGTATLDQTNLTVLDGTVYWDTVGQTLHTTATGTSGQVLTSGGAGVAPSYQTISGFVTSVTGGNNITITGTATAPVVNVSGTTNHSLLLGNATGSINSLGVATNGQLAIGSTGADPVLATLTAGANVTITNGAGTITIAANTGSETVAYTGVNHAASPYTVLATDYYISADVTAGVISILLPNAPSTGRIFVIKDKVGLSATSNITVTTVGGAVNIDGATSFVMNTAYESVQVIFNGSTYEVF